MSSPMDFSIYLIYNDKSIGRKERCCDNMTIDPPSSYVGRLEAERKQLEERIAELQAEVRVVTNLIYRHKAQTFADETSEKVNLKNVDRLFFETLIMDIIRAAKGGLRTGEIYERLGKVGYRMNYNTLRSYITKMRDKGLIKKRGSNSYYWIVAPEKYNSDTGK